jgi:hypothetical protein
LVTWTKVDAGSPQLSNTAASVSYTIIIRPDADKTFVRLKVIVD